MKSKIFLALYFASAFFFTLKAQTKNFKNEFGFKTDNDSYLGLGQDRYYTNGLFLHLRHAVDQTRLNSKVNKRIWGVEVGQQIYNPYSGSVEDISKVDRPFAGYLFAGINLSWFYNKENSLKISAQVGTIGPSSLAEDGQVLLHKTIGFYQIKGWKSQVSDELGLNLAAEYNYLLQRGTSQKTDFTFTSNARIGNTFSGGGVGLLFRAGSINQLFNSAITSSNISNKSKIEPFKTKELFFYAAPSINYIAYDATIEGGLFRKNKGPVTFGVKPLVFIQQLGLIYSQNRWTADFSLIFKSREIKSIAKAHQYGSAALYYRFN
ncbi:MAG: lipid A deacylase LpxR family protein [Flavobacterium sp.]|nr:lipid A deacylase LpxR family protein [Pedobacter sp.]